VSSEIEATPTPVRRSVDKQLGVRVPRTDRDGWVTPVQRQFLGAVCTTPFVWDATASRCARLANREKLLDQAKGAIDADADAEVIDAALQHLVETIENYEAVKREVDAELAEQLSTEVVRLTLYPQVRTD
jgi:hypothetical protein